MMSSDDRIKAEIVIDNIFRMIDEVYIHKRIDQPIEEATLSYAFVYPEAISHHLFNNIIGDFVMHLFNRGPSIKMQSKTIAMAEAVSIIEMGYQGSSNGYHAAFLDAMNPEINGLENIFQQIKEVMISIFRGKYIQWVYDTNITPLGWPTKIVIAEILLNQFKPYLPSNIQKVSPVQMADSIPLLINTIQTLEDKYRRLTGRLNV